jgi:hypothetical protein
VLQIQTKLSDNHERVQSEMQAQLTQWMLKHDEVSTSASNQISELQNLLQDEKTKTSQYEFQIREFKRDRDHHEREMDKIMSELTDSHHAQRESEQQRSNSERELVKIQMRYEAIEVSKAHTILKIVTHFSFLNANVFINNNAPYSCSTT